MLAGGARRLVSPKARLSLYLMGQKRLVKAYLEEMAINPSLFAVLEQRSVERQLEPDVMLKVGLTTGPQSVDALTAATICDAVPKPENCRVVPTPALQAEARSGAARFADGKGRGGSRCSRSRRRHVVLL